MKPSTQPPTLALHASCLSLWPADGPVSLARQQLILVPAAFKSEILLTMAVSLASKIRFSNCYIQCIVQPTTTLPDCTLYLMQDFRDPGRCILGNVYLRSNVSRLSPMFCI